MKILFNCNFDCSDGLIRIRSFDLSFFEKIMYEKIDIYRHFVFGFVLIGTLNFSNLFEFLFFYTMKS